MTEPKLKLIEDKGLVCLNIRHGSRMAVFPIAAQDEDGNLWIRYQSDPTDPHYQMDPELRPMWENGKNGSVTLVVHKSQLDVISEYGPWAHELTGEDGTTYVDDATYNAHYRQEQNKSMMCHICGGIDPEASGFTPNKDNKQVLVKGGHFGSVGPLCAKCIRELSAKV